ncbi:helix-turn-helix domain-containing protein [Brevibacterium album]|uniref:helix-turn-helix domain-containing protein n=1 Tax=Brevibacterium album TaxID=417948 RepID=UPI00054DA8EE|nr:helix-turn-helix transcriptional regulator [Brevibacterium album]
MAKVSELTPHAQISRQRYAVDPAYAAGADRLEPAGAVSAAVVRHCAEHGLSQTGLAAQLGWAQPRVARLERGDVAPSVRTLEHLARARVLEVHLTRDAATRRGRGQRRLDTPSRPEKSPS